jgi:DNA modification methylase
MTRQTKTVELYHGACRDWLKPRNFSRPVDLTFLDPPFNQAKTYHGVKDDLPSAEYWREIQQVCAQSLELTSVGGAIYFMQREKNSEEVLRVLRESGWTFQNLIIWRKKTSAVPGRYRYGKQFQIIVFATKGPRPRVFHRLRIDPPLLANQKIPRPTGVYVTDVWDDVRELTAGYFAGDEALRDTRGQRQHEQQAPVQLLLRMILSSTRPGDTVLDPYAGTGTTLVAATQVGRRAVGVEFAEKNVKLIRERLRSNRPADAVKKWLKAYEHTPGLKKIVG